jgi:preprotein translocase subunit SecG
LFFFITCLGLAVLSVKQSKSLMRDARAEKSKSDAAKPEAANSEAVKTEAAKVAASAVSLPAETVTPDAAKAQ